MKSKTLLGTLVKTGPEYMKFLIKPYRYQEVFYINTKWIGLLEFSKKIGTSKDVYHNYISSLDPCGF